MTAKDALDAANDAEPSEPPLPIDLSSWWVPARTAAERYGLVDVVPVCARFCPCSVRKCVPLWNKDS